MGSALVIGRNGVISMNNGGGNQSTFNFLPNQSIDYDPGMAGFTAGPGIGIIQGVDNALIMDLGMGPLTINVPAAQNATSLAANDQYELAFQRVQIQNRKFVKDLSGTLLLEHSSIEDVDILNGALMICLNYADEIINFFPIP